MFEQQFGGFDMASTNCEVKGRFATHCHLIHIGAALQKQDRRIRTANKSRRMQRGQTSLETKRQRGSQ